MKSFNLSYFAPLLVFIFAVFSGFIIYRAAWFGIDKHFSLLAQSFLQGDLFLSPNNLPDGDYADFNGKQYLFFGPMPSILLMPFVFVFGKNFPQMILSISSLIVVFISIFLLCNKLKFSRIDSFWLANFFTFGTVLFFVGLINTSAYVVQTVAAALAVLALFEYFGKRRWLVIGTLVAAASATRLTLFGMVIFFLLEIWRNRFRVNLARSLAFLLLPIFFSLVVLGLYNFRRFGSVFETGYKLNVSVLDKNYYNNQLGWFSPIHIPANLYILLIKAPEPVKREVGEFALEFPYLKANYLGMAIWFTSPLFLYLLLAKWEKFTFSVIGGLVATSLPSLFYWGLGAVQFGARYSLDFLPLLFLILLTAFKKGLPDFAKLLITLGIIFNCFYMSSIWNSYPLLDIFEYLD